MKCLRMQILSMDFGCCPADHSALGCCYMSVDCKLGVCMTCPAKMISGTVDQSGSMLSDDIAGKGYALLCVAQPTSDCKIMTISEVSHHIERLSNYDD